MELLPQFPGLEIDWRPCEAHPRPESHGRHSDLCARGMYIAREAGADLSEYHRRMYDIALTDRADVEDGNIIAGAVEGLSDRDAFLAALKSDSFEDVLTENNRLVWDVYDCPAVPSFRMNGQLLMSKLGVGVSKEELEAFIRQHAGA